ncbi:MAG: Cytochrome c oxidase, subunit III [Elusimicrobia bacterium]|nr:MAG: Cytochrome c oxidase, subunit III [Elusimicrobiota bacterium]
MSAHAAAAVSPYENTGVPDGKLAIWLFLASEVMLFGTLFTTYIVLRTAAASWPVGWEVLNVPLATLNTFILIASSVTIVMAHAKASAKDKAGFYRFMAFTVLLSFGFLVVKAFEYGHKFHLGIAPSTSIFYAIYFTTTGLHGFHVIGGIVWNLGLMWWASKDGWDDRLFLGRVEYAGLYWHFVDVVWIFLFPALYLL